MTDTDGDRARLPTRAAYDRWSATYDTEPNGLVVLERRYAIIRLDPRIGERLLDAGCGTGDHLVAMLGAGARAVGLDFSRRMLQAARRKAPSLPLVGADVSQRLPFASESFDGVLCSLVSEHLTDLGRFFSEIRRVLRPGGRLVLSGVHPDRVADGLTAGFEADGRRYQISAAPHTLPDFLDAASRTGFVIARLDEARVDEDVVRLAPRAERLLGEKLLFVLSARR